MAKILIADDHPLFLSGLRALLGAAGHETVSCARDAVQALAKLAECSADILVTDVSMPGWIDGISLALWTRHNFPRIKIVIVSGASGGKVERLGDEGQIISKPYSHQAIVTRIHELLQKVDK